MLFPSFPLYLEGRVLKMKIFIRTTSILPAGVALPTPGFLCLRARKVIASVFIGVIEGAPLNRRSVKPLGGIV